MLAWVQTGEQCWSSATDFCSGQLQSSLFFCRGLVLNLLASSSPVINSVNNGTLPPFSVLIGENTYVLSGQWEDLMDQGHDRSSELCCQPVGGS